MNVLAGSTSVSLVFSLFDLTTNGPATGLTITDLNLTYCRPGAAAAKSDLTALAAVDSVWAASKAIEIDSTNAKGEYRIDPPNAAFAAGVDEVRLIVTNADDDVIGEKTVSLGIVPTAEEIVNEWKSQSQADPTGFHVNVLELNGSATPINNIEVVYSTDFASNYSIANDRWDVNAAAISDDSPTDIVNAACDSALSDYGANTVVPDAAGVAPTVEEIQTQLNENLTVTTDAASRTASGLLVETTVSTSVETWYFSVAAGVQNDDAYHRCLICVTDADDSHTEGARISNWTGATRSVTLNREFTFTPAVGDVVRIFAADMPRPDAIPEAAADAAGGLPISDAGELDLDAILEDTGTTLPAAIAAVPTTGEIDDALSATHGSGVWIAGAITITPISAIVSAGEVTGTTLTAYQRCAFSYTFAVVDSTGAAIDLSAAELQFVTWEAGAADTVLIDRKSVV